MARRKQSRPNAAVSGPSAPARHRDVQLVLAVLVASLAALAAYSTDAFQLAMQEDGFVEWGTVSAYGLAAALAIVGFARARGAGRAAGEDAGTRRAWPAAIVYLGLALFCLFVAGEEISWGQRVFGFKPPDLFLEHNYQTELEIHNVLAGRFLTDHGPALVAIGYGLLLPLVCRLLSGRVRLLAPWAAAAAPSFALALWFVLVVILEYWYPLSLVGEANELVLGAVFLMDLVLRLQQTSRPPTRLLPPSPLAAAVVVTALAIAIPVALDAIHGANAGEAIELAEAELDRLGDDLAGGLVMQSRLLATASVHQRVFTAVRQGYLRFGTASAFLGRQPSPAEDASPTARRDRVGFFLDPWRNAYWMYFDHQSGVALVYSMGPNRKRDTLLTKLSARELTDAAVDGDDIGVAVTLERR